MVNIDKTFQIELIYVCLQSSRACLYALNWCDLPQKSFASWYSISKNSWLDVAGTGLQHGWGTRVWSLFGRVPLLDPLSSSLFSRFTQPQICVLKSGENFSSSSLLLLLSLYSLFIITRALILMINKMTNKNDRK